MVANGNDLTPSDPAVLAAGRLLREVGRLHVRAQRAPVTGLGLTPVTCHVLTELDRAGPLGVTELARRLALHKGWISRAVAALVRDGLLTRRPDPADARAFAVALSEAGRQRVDALHAALDGQAARVLARARAELPGLARALEVVRDALAEEVEAPAGPARPPSRRAPRAPRAF